ncbi:MAG: threonylcarbamoyl-AMP synthase [Ignavibacteriales bacterium CG18_big_fil_WC_8_21_14_2_50_31_20]|nr:MAG: threonylcarbamoyl-AMP synthase [Ignavibacteriales bacterium CG18_big_fil_WC_8_21_14_2_50_31_20]
MEFYELHPDNPQERYINKAIEVLKNGGVIIYPTDTVYALGCDIYNTKAVKRVYEIKNESETKLFSFIAPNLKDISKYAKVSDYAYKIIKRLAPGPYTFVLQAAKDVPKKLWTKRKTVGIRIPDNRITEMLTKGLGNPIISTSATTRLGQQLSNPDEIRSIFDYSVDLMLSLGEQKNLPSSIIDFSGDTPEILREGLGDLSMFY